MLFLTLQNNMNFPWTQSLQGILFWSIFNDVGVVLWLPIGTTKVLKLLQILNITCSEWRPTPLYQCYFITLHQLLHFSVYLILGLTIYEPQFLMWSGFLLQEGFLDLPCLGQRPFLVSPQHFTLHPAQHLTTQFNGCPTTCFSPTRDYQSRNRMC